MNNELIIEDLLRIEPFAEKVEDALMTMGCTLQVSSFVKLCSLYEIQSSAKDFVMTGLLRSSLTRRYTRLSRR